MADGPIEGLPAGASVVPLPAANSQVEGLPPGATLRPITQSAQQTQQTTSTPPQQPNILERAIRGVANISTGGETGRAVAEGAIKEAGQTVAGVSSLLHKIPVVGETLAPQEGITSLEKQTELRGGPEHVGAVGEQAGEWMIGEEAVGALSELAKASKYLKTPAMLQAYLAKSPKVAEALKTIAHGVTIGGVQGGVQGAAHDDTAGGAAAGAFGGGAGGALAEGLSAGLPKLAKILGLGGLTPEQNMTKAAGGSLNVGTQNWEQSLQKTLPLLADKAKSETIKTVGDFEDLVHSTANELWQKHIAPQISNNKNEVIAGSNIADMMRNVPGIDEMKDLFPEEAEGIEAFAKKFDKDIPLPKAQKYLELLNAKLKGYYKLSPDARHALGITDGAVSAYESASDGLRDEIYKKLDDLGEKTPALLRQQYGALKEVQRVFGKRATVADRQMPLNLQQTLGLIAGGTEAATAILMGHPMTAIAGAAPIAIATGARLHNAPENLINTALRQTLESVSPSATRAAAKATVKSGAAFTGSQATREARVTFKASDGSTHSVPADQLDAARKVDPNLTVLP